MPALNICYRGGDKDGRPGYFIGFSYDEELVETLKKTIPHTHRGWSPQNKLWWVHEDFDPVLTGMFGNFDALAHQQQQMF